MGQILNGSNLIKELYKGSTPIKEVWIGNIKIFPSGTGGGGGSSGTDGFITDVTPVTVSKTTVNASSSSTTNTTYLKFLATGYMDFDGATTSLPWTRWNSNPAALITPKIKFTGAGVIQLEISLNGGSTWAAVAQNTEYSLTAGVWLRLVKTGTVSGSTTIPDIEMVYINNSNVVGVIALTVTSAISVASNPFVTNFGGIGSEVHKPWNQEATAEIYIYGRSHPVFPGKLVAAAALVLGDPIDYDYYDWVVSGQTAPAGAYTVVLSGFSFINNTTYTLPDSGFLNFELTAIGSSPSNGETKTDSGTVTIRKDGVTVSSGTFSFTAVSNGVIQ